MQNALDEPTTVHWHGLLLPSAMDVSQASPKRRSRPARSSFMSTRSAKREPSGTLALRAARATRSSGPFVIEAQDEPLRYDHDYILFLTTG